MTTINDKFKDVGLFESMATIGNLKFISDFLTAKQIDTLYKIKFGDRMLANQFINCTPSEIAEMVYNSYANTWNKQYDLLATEMPLLKTFEKSSTHKSDSTENRSNKTKETNIDTTKVSAFNTEELVNDNNNTTDRNSDITESNKNTNNVVVTESGFKGNSYRLLKNAIDYLKVNLLYDIIMLDINNLISLNIF